MAPKEPKISKQAATGTMRQVTFTIPETLEKITKPENSKSQSVIMGVYKIALLTIYGTIKHKRILM